MGECLMDVTPRRAHLLTGDTSKELGQPERAASRCHKWRVMAEKYGSVPVMLERHKDEIIRYVFDGEPAAGLSVPATWSRTICGWRQALPKPSPACATRGSNCRW